MALRICALAIILAVWTVPGFAMIVNHEAPDGIAVIHTCPSAHGESPGILVLGTDGQIYKMEKKGELKKYDFPSDLELQWPVDFEEISAFRASSYPFEKWN